MDAQSSQGLEVTWKRSLAVWWSLMWRLVLASAAAGFVLGALAALLLLLSGRQELAGSVAGTVGYLAAVPASLWAVRRVLRLEFREFAIRLAPRSGGTR
jgi:hypothetical protein